MKSLTNAALIYQALQEAYVLLDDGDRRVLREIDLTPTQYSLLSQLGKNADTGKTITELSQRLLCTRGNATRLVRRLEQQGLVRCTSDERDQRLVRVSLTAAGIERRRIAEALHTESVARRFSTMQGDEQGNVRKLLQQIVQMLRADLASQPTTVEDTEEE